MFKLWLERLCEHMEFRTQGKETDTEIGILYVMVDSPFSTIWGL